MPHIIAETAEGRIVFDADADKKLVLAIEDNNIDIMHRCGGNARCTTCRVEILEGTELVRVSASAGSPQESQAIVRIYLRSVEERDERQARDRIVALMKERDSARERLKRLRERIARVAKWEASGHPDVDDVAAEDLRDEVEALRRWLARIMDEIESSRLQAKVRSSSPRVQLIAQSW